MHNFFGHYHGYIFCHQNRIMIFYLVHSSPIGDEHFGLFSFYDIFAYYYIHTEKYSPKSSVVNFRTQISSSQSEERTMVFTRERNDTSNQNRERCFFTCEKNDTSNQKPQRCVSFAPKFPPFIAACSAASHTFNEKSFTQSFSR